MIALQHKKEEIFVGLLLFSIPIKGPLNSIFLIIASLFFIYQGSREKTFKYLKFYGVSFLFFLFQFLSFLQSNNKYEAQKKVVLYLSFLLFPFIFSNLTTKKINIYNVFRCFFYGVVFTVFYGFLRFLYDAFILEVRYDYGRALDLFTKYTPQHIYFSMFILIVIYYLFKNYIKNKSYTVFCIPFLYLLLFFLTSRIAILIAVFVLPILFYKDLRNVITKQQLVAFFSILIGATIVFVLNNDFVYNKIYYSYHDLFNIANDKQLTGVSYRKKIWITAINTIKQSWMFGYGIGDVQEILNQQYIANNFSDLKNLNTHNQYLQWLLHYGVFITLFLVYSLSKIIYQLKKKNAELLLFCWFVLLSFCFTESILQRQWGVILFALVLNYSIYLTHKKQTNY